jgi:hypothetical protein
MVVPAAPADQVARTAVGIVHQLVACMAVVGVVVRIIAAVRDLILDREQMVQ